MITPRPNIARALPARDPGEAMRVTILQADGSEIVAVLDLRAAVIMQQDIAAFVHMAVIRRERDEMLRRSDWC